MHGQPERNIARQHRMTRNSGASFRDSRVSCQRPEVPAKAITFIFFHFGCAAFELTLSQWRINTVKKIKHEDSEEEGQEEEEEDDCGEEEQEEEEELNELNEAHEEAEADDNDSEERDQARDANVSLRKEMKLKEKLKETSSKGETANDCDGEEPLDEGQVLVAQVPESQELEDAVSFQPSNIAEFLCFSVFFQTDIQEHQPTNLAGDDNQEVHEDTTSSNFRGKKRRRPSKNFSAKDSETGSFVKNEFGMFYKEIVVEYERLVFINDGFFQVERSPDHYAKILYHAALKVMSPEIFARFERRMEELSLAKKSLSKSVFCSSYKVIEN